MAIILKTNNFYFLQVFNFEVLFCSPKSCTEVCMSVIWEDESEPCLTHLPETGFSLGVTVSSGAVFDGGAPWAVHKSGWSGTGTRTCIRYLLF